MNIATIDGRVVLMDGLMRAIIAAFR